MIKFPPCKINLGLHVVEKRNDGFHNIETMFYPLPLTDAIEIVPATDGITQFTSSGNDIPPDGKNNLCERAYEIVREKYDLPPVKIHLHKNIPTGAGLGGGSSDAAFTLLILNEMFDLELSKKQLLLFATTLGSDCAFFIYNEPCFATGRGEILQPRPLSLHPYHILLVKPDIHVNTAIAYSGITPTKPSVSLNDVFKLSVKSWKDILVNDFEKTVFLKFPEIASIKDKLYSLGADYACMSGSGAAVFGLFERKPDFDVGLEFKDCFTWGTEL
jgi:4-diphosphocytidyl-2-C-methyl-D-erythritol kinase